METQGSKIRKWGTVIGIVALFIIATVFSLKWGEKETYKMVYIPKIVDESNAFWCALIEGVQMGAKEYGVEMEIISGASETDNDGQNDAIERAIEMKPDAILISPCSFTENTDVIGKVKEAGIDLVLIDSKIDRDMGQPLVATDNIEAGKELGEYSKSFLNPEDQIGVVGHVKGASTAIDREKGLREGLGEYEKSIQEVVFCGSSYETAQTLTVEMMEKYPKLTMIIGLNEYSAVGAARAVEAAGRERDIIVMGFDNSVEQMQMMERGTFKGTVIQQPFNMGYLGVQQAVLLEQKKKVEKNLSSGSRLITPENMYEEENQRLLYPFSGR